MLYVKFGKNQLHGSRWDVVWKCWCRQTTDTYKSSPMSLWLSRANNSCTVCHGQRSRNSPLNQVIHSQTRAGVCKNTMPPTFACPQIRLNLQCRKSTKKFWTLPKCLTDNLHIIPYLLTKFQAPSSNSFQDILLTSLKCQNFWRAITPDFYFFNLIR